MNVVTVKADGSVEAGENGVVDWVESHFWDVWRGGVEIGGDEVLNPRNSGDDRAFSAIGCGCDNEATTAWGE